MFLCRKLLPLKMSKDFCPRLYKTTAESSLSPPPDCGDHYVKGCQEKQRGGHFLSAIVTCVQVLNNWAEQSLSCSGSLFSTSKGGHSLLIVFLQTIYFHLLHYSEIPSLSICVICEPRVSFDNRDVTDEIAGRAELERRWARRKHKSQTELLSRL